MNEDDYFEQGVDPYTGNKLKTPTPPTDSKSAPSPKCARCGEDKGPPNPRHPRMHYTRGFGRHVFVAVPPPSPSEEKEEP